MREGSLYYFRISRREQNHDLKHLDTGLSELLTIPVYKSLAHYGDLISTTFLPMYAARICDVSIGEHFPTSPIPHELQVSNPIPETDTHSCKRHIFFTQFQANLLIQGIPFLSS